MLMNNPLPIYTNLLVLASFYTIKRPISGQSKYQTPQITDKKLKSG